MDYFSVYLVKEIVRQTLKGTLISELFPQYLGKFTDISHFHSRFRRLGKVFLIPVPKSREIAM